MYQSRHFLLYAFTSYHISIHIYMKKHRYLKMHTYQLQPCIYWFLILLCKIIASLLLQKVFAVCSIIASLSYFHWFYRYWTSFLEPVFRLGCHCFNFATRYKVIYGIINKISLYALPTFFNHLILQTRVLDKTDDSLPRA